MLNERQLTQVGRPKAERPLSTRDGQVRFPGPDARANFEALQADRASIDAEFVSAGLPPLEWQTGEVPALSITTPAPSAASEEESTQRQWMALAANQFVNSLRPRLRSLSQELAA
jgi:hypothetical protein